MHFTMDDVEKIINGRTSLGIKPGPERVNILLESAGNPERHIQGIHIAGTNGKGSTSAFIKQALVKNGYKVGTFNSPSLEGLSGHIAINDTTIPDDDFIKLFIKLEPVIQRMDEAGEPPTTFEIITVMAFMYFAQHTDIAIIETGMGGREDATNVFRPLLSIITNVALDHTGYLGGSLQAIAAHKAGIIKEGVPVITGDLNQEVIEVVEAQAASHSAPLFQIGDTFYYQMSEGQQFDQYQWNDSTVTLNVSLHMKGIHQIKNSSLAIMALAILKENGYTLSWKAVLQGISQARLPGRYETVHRHPTIIIDGAHNPAGIDAFLDTVKQDAGRGRQTLIFAAFKDKDIEAMLNLVKPQFQKIFLTTFDHPRAAKELDYETLIESNRLTFNPAWDRVLEHLLAKHEAKDIYYIVGSIHFIEKVRKYFTERRCL